MDVRDAEARDLLERILEELRALREAARQSELLEAMVRKLDSIERTQYGCAGPPAPPRRGWGVGFGA